MSLTSPWLHNNRVNSLYMACITVWNVDFDTISTTKHVFTTSLIYVVQEQVNTALLVTLNAHLYVHTYIHIIICLTHPLNPVPYLNCII